MFIQQKIAKPTAGLLYFLLQLHRADETNNVDVHGCNSWLSIQTRSCHCPVKRSTQKLTLLHCYIKRGPFLCPVNLTPSDFALDRISQLTCNGFSLFKIMCVLPTSYIDLSLRFVVLTRQKNLEMRGTLGFVANFWFWFQVFALKNCGFSVLVSCPVCRFLQFSLWFSVFCQQ